MCVRMYVRACVHAWSLRYLLYCTGNYVLRNIYFVCEVKIDEQITNTSEKKNGNANEMYHMVIHTDVVYSQSCINPIPNPNPIPPLNFSPHPTSPHPSPQIHPHPSPPILTQPANPSAAAPRY